MYFEFSLGVAYVHVERTLLSFLGSVAILIFLSVPLHETLNGREIITVGPFEMYQYVIIWFLSSCVYQLCYRAARKSSALED